MPVALISIRISPAFGPSMSTVSMVSGSPAFQATAARVFIFSSWSFSPLPDRTARRDVILREQARWRNESVMARIFVGTSGWSYASWRGPFFPKEVMVKHHLQYYATQFSTTELNGVFY